MKKKFIIIIFNFFTTLTPFVYSLDKQNIGIQAKYITGLGLTLNTPVNNRFYINGSVSWMFLILDISGGLDFKLTNNLDISLHIHKMLVANLGNNEPKETFFLEPRLGFRFTKHVWLEGGILLSVTKDKTLILNAQGQPEYLTKTEFINYPNIGIVFILF
jgi:hypothetical protein